MEKQGLGNNNLKKIQLLGIKKNTWIRRPYKVEKAVDQSYSK